MESTKVDKVALIAQSVSSYGAKIAAVFHNHSLNAEKVPRRFEGSTNIIDSTVTTLNQIVELLNDEASNESRKLFSEQGLQYVQLLTIECATALAKIEPFLASACLTYKELKEKRKLDKKKSAQGTEAKIDPLTLELDSKAFLELVETAKWSRVAMDVAIYMERLYDLQLHLLLVYQVIKVGSLSKDLSSGKVDVKSIVAFHNRISRTADLIGIKPPRGQVKHTTKHDSLISSSDDDESSTDSDSSMDLRTAKRTIKNLRRRRLFPPPPPPPPPTSYAYNPSGTTTAPPIIILPPTTTPAVTVDAVHPPLYTESVSNGAEKSTIKEPVDEEKVKSCVPEEPTQGDVTNATKSLTLEPRLFKSNPTGLGFKIKSLFRSKHSLVEEMKKVLDDSESRLIAYVLRGHDVREVPHSAFHSLEATHMRTILSQLRNDSWYHTFTSLAPSENRALQPLIRPETSNGSESRDIVVLKVIERSKMDSWSVLLRDIFRRYPAAYRVGFDRVLLVIVREQLVDGKWPSRPSTQTASTATKSHSPTSALETKTVRPPPGLPTPIRSNTRFCDLRFPPPPSPPDGWHVNWRVGPFRFLPASPSAPPGPAEIVAIDALDAEIEKSMNVYTEYILRETEIPNVPGGTKTWSRIALSQESSEKTDLLRRIDQFTEAGGNIMEVKLRLAPDQSAHLDRLMDEIRKAERDQRFDWSWVEISLYTHSGMVSYKDIMRTDQDMPFNFAYTASHIHVIAKRALRPHCNPKLVYDQFMKGFIPPPPPGGHRPVFGPPPPPHFGPPPPPFPGPPPPPPGNMRLRRRSSFSSMSNTDSSNSNSSAGEVRRVLRKYKARKIGQNIKRRNRSPVGSDSSGSDSDSSDEEEEEDVIEIKVELQRGDDVVRALLELWTPQTEDKGKGMEAL